MSRRFAFVILVPGLALATGCFAFFPLDDYQDGAAVIVDGGGFETGNSEGGSSSSSGNVKPDLTKGRVFFVTKTSVKPDFGGIPGADEICATAAKDASLPGTYAAFLSIKGEPVLRFITEADATDAGLPIIDATGRQIAPSFTALLAGQEPAIQIDRDENGGQINFTNDGGIPACEVNEGVAWTGSDTNFSASNADCALWRTTSDGTSATVGFGVNRGSWLSTCKASCARTAHLYCTQKPE